MFVNPQSPRIRRVTNRTMLAVISALGVLPAILSVMRQYLLSRLGGGAHQWSDAYEWRALAFVAIDWLALGLVTPVTYYLSRRFPLVRARWRQRLIVHIFGAALLTLCWASVGMLAALLLHTYPGVSPLARNYVAWIAITAPQAVVIYLAVLAGVHAYAYFTEAQTRQAEASRLGTQLADAKLAALRMQLHPHFLYNTLNAIAILMRDEDIAGSLRMLELLSDLLRAVLRPDQPHEVPLQEELTFLQLYLTIEQIRFSDRLTVQWRIDDGTRRLLVPAFLLQPLVENAIKHGIAKQARTGTITISARISWGSHGGRRQSGGGVVDLDLELAVIDDGVGYGSSVPEGIGLSNTRERLQTLYSGAASLEIATAPDGGTQAIVRLPRRASNE